MYSQFSTNIYLYTILQIYIYKTFFGQQHSDSYNKTNNVQHEMRSTGKI